MTNSHERISRDKAIDALSRSGYLLENRLDTILRKKGYYVDSNTAYPDPDTGKSRELDLYGILGIEVGPSGSGYIFLNLAIECINNPQPIAFITKEPQVNFLYHYDIKMSGLPVKIVEKNDSWETLSEYLAMDEYHHYCRGRIATQFCSFKKKSGSGEEWMALHEDSHFDSFKKLSAFVEHSIAQHFKGWTFKGPEPININFYYPIVVVQGELYDVRQSKKKSLKLIDTKHIQYRWANYMKTEEIVFQIDVITESYVPTYLSIINNEMRKTARLLRRRNAIIRKSVDEIKTKAEILSTPDEVRKAMEF